MNGNKLFTFEDLNFISHPVGQGIWATKYFPNGFGISVVRFRIYGGMYGSHTSNENEFECAILKGTELDSELCYDSGITDDVIGHLTDKEVSKLMKQIQEIPLS